MRLTTKKLKQIIKEELSEMMKPSPYRFDDEDKVEKKMRLTTKKLKQIIKEDTQMAEKIAILGSFVELISSDLVRIHIYGDSAVMAGDVIECKFPEATGLTKDPKLNRLRSGKYMISSLRHMIVLGDRYVHTMSTELIKGNYLEA